MGCLVTIKVGSKKYSYFSSKGELGNPSQLTLSEIVNELINGDSRQVYYSNAIHSINLINRVAEDVNSKVGSKGSKQYLKEIFQDDAITVNFDNEIKKINASLSRTTDDSKRQKLLEQLQWLQQGKLLTNAKRLIGSSSLQELREKWPWVKFDDSVGLNENESILLVDEKNYNGVALGGAIRLGEQTIYLISNPYDARNLAFYLTSRKAVQELDVDTIKELNLSQYQEALDFIINERGWNKKSASKEELNKRAIVYFFNNSAKYLYSTYPKTGEVAGDLYTDLVQLIKDQILLKYTRKSYSDPLINGILQRASYWSEVGAYKISKQELFKLMKMFPDTSIDIDSLSEAEDSEIIDTLDAYFKSKSTPASRIWSKGQIFYIRLAATSLDNLDITYDTIKAFTRSNKFVGGYYIYTDPQNNKYYVSKKRAVVPTSIIQSFDSMQDAVQYINDKVKTQSIVSQWDRNKIQPNLENGVFRVNVTNKSEYIPNEEITMIQYQLPNDNLINGSNPLITVYNEQIYWSLPYLNQQLKQIFNNLIVQFDDPNKAIIFFYELQKQLPNINIFSTPLNKSQIDTALTVYTQVSGLKTQDYVVLQRLEKEKNLKSHILYLQNIETPVTDNEQYEDKIPAAQVLNKFATIINTRYKQATGAKEDLINIITQKEVEALGIKGVKGFVKDGKIYINATLANLEDLYHEYAHLFLGMMKASNLEAYTKLLEKFSNYALILDEKVRLKNQEAYKDMNDYDLTEEAFVHVLSDYIINDTSFEQTLDLLSPKDQQLQVAIEQAIRDKNYDRAKELVSTIPNSEKIFKALQQEDGQQALDLLKQLNKQDITSLLSKSLENFGAKKASSIKTLFRSFNGMMTYYLNEKSDLLFKVDSSSPRAASERLSTLINNKAIIQEC